MIDVAEGDSYVVDLKHQKDLGSKNPKAWRRYLIDCGKKMKDKSRLDAISNSLFLAGGNKILLGGPWDESPLVNKKGPNIPPLSGIMITHSDADHAGGAPTVIDTLTNLDADNTPANNVSGYAIPIMMSPMWLWTSDLIRRCEFENKVCQVKSKHATKTSRFMRFVTSEVQEIANMTITVRGVGSPQGEV